MRNWSTDTTKLKGNKKALAIWQLEQQLNFGLHQGETLEPATLKKYLPVLKIDQDTRNFLEFILYDKKPLNHTSKKIS
jgi:hypothetical protein